MKKFIFHIYKKNNFFEDKGEYLTMVTICHINFSSAEKCLSQLLKSLNNHSVEQFYFAQHKVKQQKLPF